MGSIFADRIAQRFGEGNVFTGVCHSVHRLEDASPCCRMYAPPLDAPPGCTSSTPWMQPLLDASPIGCNPHWMHPPWMHPLDAPPPRYTPFPLDASPWMHPRPRCSMDVSSLLQHRCTPLPLQHGCTPSPTAWPDGQQAVGTHPSGMHSLTKWVHSHLRFSKLM